ncbi:MAG: hypothetical protein JWQ27_269 [Ferruginibacter sp.]|nr:hypothetical protein [Ferruginibacter sp.]
MNYVQPTDVVVKGNGMEIEGTIQGNESAFSFTSSALSFYQWFPSGRLSSVEVDVKDFNRYQLEIYNACLLCLKNLSEET